MKLNRRTNGLLYVTLAWCIALLLGCSLFPKKVTVVPVDENGATLEQTQVSVNGSPVGQGATELKLKDSAAVTLDAGEGYFAQTIRAGKASPSVVRVVLQKDLLWEATTADANQVGNRWITISVSEDVQTDDEWWSSVVAALAGDDYELEMMDAKSGFIRTAWKERRFSNAWVKRRFVGNTVSQTPLKWRLKYEISISENDGKSWTQYDRIFKSDADIVAEIRSRIQRK